MKLLGIDIKWIIAAVVVAFLVGLIRFGKSADRAAGHYIVW